MTIRLAILGAGGLGKGMARVAQHRPDFKLVAMADSQGFCYQSNGLNVDTVLPLKTVADYPNTGEASKNAIIDLLKAHGTEIDGIFLALPNLPVDFFANTVQAILDNTPFRGVLVDALKRTEAVERLLPLNSALANRDVLYITGAGATPGFLTTAAAVAAQSFVEVLNVDIHFGVGIECWDNYKATIREDLIHMDGFDTAKVAAMSDADIEIELKKRNGMLELTNMEHADDIILELAGVCPRGRVTVGGLVDTQNAKKPVSTTVTVKGRTVDGEIGQHQFILSDVTTMVDNVCGPALGFMLSGWEHRTNGMSGLIHSASIMPCFGQSLRQDEATPAERDAVAAV